MYPSAIPGSIASTADLRKHNCFQVYHHIYHQKQITQAALMQDLKMSAPTISQYLNELLAAGFIEKSGFASSSGGRKPSLFRIIPDARISAGLEIVSSRVLLIITNLYGEVIFKKQLTAEFSNAPSYFDTVCQWANQCIRQTVPDDGRHCRSGASYRRWTCRGNEPSARYDVPSGTVLLPAALSVQLDS